MDGTDRGEKDKVAGTKKEKQEDVRNEKRVNLVWDAFILTCFLDTQVKDVHHSVGVLGLNLRERTKTS